MRQSAGRKIKLYSGSERADEAEVGPREDARNLASRRAAAAIKKLLVKVVVHLVASVERSGGR